MTPHKWLMVIASDFHQAQIERMGIEHAQIDLSIREALRFQRRVDEVAAMPQRDRDYFEGHIPKDPQCSCVLSSDRHHCVIKHGRGCPCHV